MPNENRPFSIRASRRTGKDDGIGQGVGVGVGVDGTGGTALVERRARRR